MAAQNKAIKKTKPKFNIFKHIFNEIGNGIDVRFLAITLILLGFGLIMLYSASYVYGIYRFEDGATHFIRKQRMCAALGLIIMIVATRVDYHFIKRFSFGLFIVTLRCLVLALLMPEYNGCHRWITIKGLGTFQPSEIAKLCVVICFARSLEANYGKRKGLVKDLTPYVIMLVPILGLLFLEPHLSCIVIICALAAVLMLVGGVNPKYFILFIVLALLTVGTLFAIFHNQIGAYIGPRIENWLHPEKDLQGEGYQSYVSLLAIGSGKWFGVGFSNSRMKHLHLPEAYNDFIYAIVVEELGFIGGLAVIVLFVLFFWRGMRIALHAKDKFGCIVVTGIVAQISMQAFLNIAVATNLIPNTGISLPFFSEGGTALIMLLGEIGIVLSVSRSCIYETENEELPE